MKIIKSKKTASREIENFVFIVVPEKDTLCKLDEVGSFIWGLLDDPKNIDEITENVYNEFEVDYKTAKDDVENFINLLLEKDIVEKK